MVAGSPLVGQFLVVRILLQALIDQGDHPLIGFDGFLVSPCRFRQAGDLEFRVQHVAGQGCASGRGVR